ncbi:MAG: hypothetical protein A2Y36_09525 [Treponema sp. GWA1_62_8]|nr:MAG: hypothetical protein A2Y36_09525 [Treponema sp. GWA1_62_8]
MIEGLKGIDARGPGADKLHVIVASRAGAGRGHFRLDQSVVPFVAVAAGVLQAAFPLGDEDFRCGEARGARDARGGAARAPRLRFRFRGEDRSPDRLRGQARGGRIRGQARGDRIAAPGGHPLSFGRDVGDGGFGQAPGGPDGHAGPLDRPVRDRGEFGPVRRRRYGNEGATAAALPGSLPGVDMDDQAAPFHVLGAGHIQPRTREERLARLLAA